MFKKKVMLKRKNPIGIIISTVHAGSILPTYEPDSISIIINFMDRYVKIVHIIPEKIFTNMSRPLFNLYFLPLSRKIGRISIERCLLLKETSKAP